MAGCYGPQQDGKYLEAFIVLTKMALHSNDIRLCSIFVNPDGKRNYDDAVVQVNNWLPGKEDELIDISWPRFAARVHPDDGRDTMRLFGNCVRERYRK